LPLPVITRGQRGRWLSAPTGAPLIVSVVERNARAQRSEFDRHRTAGNHFSLQKTRSPEKGS